MATESTQLVPKPDASPKPFYFLAKKRSSTQSELEGGVRSNSIRRSNSKTNSNQGSSFGWLFGLFSAKSSNGYTELTGLEGKPRKIPVKIEPKVFFANERTFLAWLHMSVTLATISIAILAFADANAWSQIYGMLLMPVAISFCMYSLWMYMKRARMIRRKDPGPYDDNFGPVALAWMLAAAIIMNFLIKLYELAT